MSLVHTKKFLESLDSYFPISDEGEDKRHHSLMLEGDKVILMLHVGSEWKTFALSGADLHKNPDEIVFELKQLLKEDITCQQHQ